MKDKNIEKEVKDITSKAKPEESKLLIPDSSEELKQYRYADVIISCASCGKDTVINHPGYTNVEVGLNFPPLYTTNKHFMALSCEHCKAALTIKFIQAKTCPAYDFSLVGYGIKEDATLTWVAGEKALSYNVYLTSVPDENFDEKDIEFKMVGTSTVPEFKLSLDKNTSYRYRIDTVYDGKLAPSDIVFISTTEEVKMGSEATTIPSADTNSKND